MARYRAASGCGSNEYRQNLSQTEQTQKAVLVMEVSQKNVHRSPVTDPLCRDTKFSFWIATAELLHSGS